MHCAIVVILLTTPLLAGDADTRDASFEHDDSLTAPDDRVAWSYTEGDVSATIYESADGEWSALRSDGKEVVYDEVGRTQEHVELQNRSSKLFVRLTPGRGYWRRPRDENWSTWVRGEWGARPEAAPPIDPVVEHHVRLVYFVPSDRTPASDYAVKIRLIMEVVNEVYRGDLRRQGLSARGLEFESNNDIPVVHLVRGAQPARHYNNAPEYNANEQWNRVVPEIRDGIGGSRRQLIVAFVETYENGPAQNLWPGVIARGSYYNADGGMAVYSAHLLRDEFCATSLEEQRRLFFDETPIIGRRALGHGMNSPRCEFVEDGFGAVCHELGHALGLPHDRRDDARYIMGNGFRNLRRNFGPREGAWVGFSLENGRLLGASRFLADEPNLSDNELPTVTVTETARTRMTTTVRVSAADNTGLRALVFVDKNAGTVIDGRRLTGKSQELTERLELMAGADGEVDLMVIVVDDGGNQSRVGIGE